MGFGRWNLVAGKKNSYVKREIDGGIIRNNLIQETLKILWLSETKSALMQVNPTGISHF